MASNRTLHIEISSVEAALAEFRQFWRDAEAGAAVTPREAVGFESMEQLLSTLTPKRWALLRRLREIGPVSVYALAKDLKRHYANVHGDVDVLERLGVIERDEDNRIVVPWDEIQAHLRFAA